VLIKFYITVVSSLGSTSLITNEEQRVEVKRKFQKWYNSMRRLDHRIERVSWN
jgi:hypothetical protein